VAGGTKAYEAAGELLKVLSAPARLAIVAELAGQPRYVHELAERLEMSQPLVSHHLRVLRDARLVGVERHGREAVYSLADRHAGHIVADAVHHSREEQALGNAEPGINAAHPGDLPASADPGHYAMAPSQPEGA
jgi:ArsR family transcriptional regulator, zinc-responsive transcriptional repressor